MEAFALPIFVDLRERFYERKIARDDVELGLTDVVVFVVVVVLEDGLEQITPLPFTKAFYYEQRRLW